MKGVHVRVKQLHKQSATTTQIAFKAERAEAVNFQRVKTCCNATAKSNLLLRCTCRYGLLSLSSSMLCNVVQTCPNQISWEPNEPYDHNHVGSSSLANKDVTVMHTCVMATFVVLMNGCVQHLLER